MVTDEKFVIPRGELAKYQITITRQDFSQRDDDFCVHVSWGMFGQYIEISKSKMIHDEEGRWFMVFDTSEMSGPVKAACVYKVTDSDMEVGARDVVDYQWLCFVTEGPTAKFCCKFETGGDGHVVYTRVYASDVNTAYLNLRDSNKANLLDSNGKQLRVHRADEDYYEDK